MEKAAKIFEEVAKDLNMSIQEQIEDSKKTIHDERERRVSTWREDSALHAKGVHTEGKMLTNRI